MPDAQHIIRPTSTRSSLNFFANPSGLLHENVDDTDLTCPSDAIQIPGDYVSTSEPNGRVKFRFTPPILQTGNTFYGIVCNACGAWTNAIALQGIRTLDHQTTNVIGELFLEGVKISTTSSSFDLPDLLQYARPEFSLGGWSFFFPDAVGRLAFHEAIIAAGLNPDTVNWNSLDIQFYPESLQSGEIFSLLWVAGTIYQGAIDPVTTGGVFGAGSAEVNSFPLIGGGCLLGGEAKVRPIIERPSGGIIISPSHHATSIETRTSIGGAKFSPYTISPSEHIEHFDDLVSDTVLLLSGGSSNGDPLLSLGGEVSITEVGSDLFDDFLPEESATGLEDYRCIYVFNTLPNSLKGIRLWLESSPVSSAAVILGVEESDDIQEINFSFFSGIGTMTLDFGGEDVIVTADSDLDIFALNFQTSLRDNTYLTDVIVDAQMVGTTVNFKVTFAGSDGKRKQPIFALVDNSLGGSPTISINQISVGSPINATAETIGTDISVPSNPEFRETTEVLPIIIPNLFANEGFPLWIKRTIETNPPATRDDGFFLQICTDPIAFA